MRSIYKDSARHKGSSTARRLKLAGRHRFPATLLLGVLLVSGFGCSGDKESGADSQGEISTQTSENQSAALQDGPLRIDDSGWRAFRSLTDRIHAGEQLSLADLTELGEEKAFRIWSQSLGTNAPSPDRVGRWVEGTFRTELGRTGPVKFSGSRQSMIKTYKYSYRSRESVESQLREWSSPDHKKAFMDRAKLWVTPANFPDPLTILFLPTLPELRYFSENVIVDTGVLYAGGNRQLENQLIALLYRNLQVAEIPPNQDSPAENSIANTFRILHSEGIATWIEDSPNTIFRSDHYSLFKVALVPDTYFQNGLRSIKFMNQYMPKMFSDTDEMNRLGPVFHVEARTGGTLPQAGYAMVGTIIHHLGENKLLEIRDSVPGFLAAYQEAALKNPIPLPLPGAPGSQLPESMPSLDPEVFEQIQQLLLRKFPR